jgi:uncharacterized cofD-like protein
MKRIVRIGGGSSGYSLLRGLKQFPVEITAAVNMFDSGGSSGVLRDELGILPPGDVRRALAALASDERAGILRDLFNYRFKEGGSVNGHSFGNLFLAALADIYGSDMEAIRKASVLLDITGTVLPVTTDRSHIHVRLENGEEIAGETNIDIPKHDGSLRITDLWLDPPAKLSSETDSAIRDAEVVVIGPGDLYSSIAPNLLVEGMPEALAASKARKVVVVNLMTKWGETHGFSATDFLRELLRYSKLSRFDVAICHTGAFSPEVLARYAEHKQYPMSYEIGAGEYATEVITGDFASEADIARHDGEKLAAVIAGL